MSTDKLGRAVVEWVPKSQQSTFTNAEFRVELMKRGWIPPYKDASARLAELMPDAELVVEVNARFGYLYPPAHLTEGAGRLSNNAEVMRITHKLEPLIKEMVITALLVEAERAKEGE